MFLKIVPRVCFEREKPGETIVVVFLSAIVNLKSFLYNVQNHAKLFESCCSSFLKQIRVSRHSECLLLLKKNCSTSSCSHHEKKTDSTFRL